MTDRLRRRKTKSVLYCGDVVEMWPILWSGEENENGRKMVRMRWPTLADARLEFLQVVTVKSGDNPRIGSPTYRKAVP